MVGKCIISTAALLAAAMVGRTQAQAAPTPPAPLTAGIANPQVLYVTRYDGQFCSGPINTVTAYPIGQCITTVNAKGVVVGGAKVLITTAGGQTQANYQTFKSPVCGDTAGTYTLWSQTSYNPVDVQNILQGGSLIPNIDECTDNRLEGMSFRAWLDSTAPTAANPNPLNFPAMKISSYVPSCKSASTFASPVVVYRSVMNTCYTSGFDFSKGHTRPATTTVNAAPTLTPTKSIPANAYQPASTLPQTIMGLQSASSVCVNGRITEQFFSNPVCSYSDMAEMIGYSISQGPGACVDGNADMEVPGVATYPMMYLSPAGSANSVQYFVGPYKLLSCSSGDPVPVSPPNPKPSCSMYPSSLIPPLTLMITLCTRTCYPNPSPTLTLPLPLNTVLHTNSTPLLQPNLNNAQTGWVYTAAFYSGDCSGNMEAMHEGKPTDVCIYNSDSTGSTMSVISNPNPNITLTLTLTPTVPEAQCPSALHPDPDPDHIPNPHRNPSSNPSHHVR